MAFNQKSLAWLKQNLWDKLDRPETYTVENVLKDLRSQTDAISKSETPPPSLAASSISFSDVIKMFQLQISDVDQSFETWRLGRKDLFDVPTTLKDSLSELSYVMGSSTKNEAYVRCRIDSTLISCIAAERRLAEGNSSSDASQPPRMVELERPVTPGETKPLQLQLETPLKCLVEYEGKPRMLTGFADYSIWYDEIDLGTNLVVIEAKRDGYTGSARSQCLAYMGIVHTVRRSSQRMHKVIYGICTDGTQYRFLRIDNNSIVTQSQILEWGAAIINKMIVSYIRYIIRAAIHASPRTSPVKPAAQRETLLEAFNTRAQFDYGFRNLNFKDNSCDEVDNDDDIIQLDEDEEIPDAKD